MPRDCNSAHVVEPIHREPIIDHGRLPPLQARTEPDVRFWPADRPLPKVWQKPRQRVLPCPMCNRVCLDDMGQAVVCTRSDDAIAYFRCRACGHRWSLPVRHV